MSTVGIIANPAAGKDIRRLVARGRVVPDYEKVNILARVMAGLDATGVERVLVMPDAAMLGLGAVDGLKIKAAFEVLDMTVYNADRDSTLAARMMADEGVGCLVTLGGDGTNRAVAKASGDVPIVPISTGTNNVFPAMVEGTVAGLAAGVVACGLVDLDVAARVSPVLDVRVGDGPRDIALVDVAVTTDRFLGARAVWDMDKIRELFLSSASDDSIGLSAIGARLRPVGGPDSAGMHIRLGPDGTTVMAPVAPGLIVPVGVRSWSPLRVGEPVRIDASPGTLALDGERTLTVAVGERAEVVFSTDGPRVISVEKALREATRAGVFTRPNTAHIG